MSSVIRPLVVALAVLIVGVSVARAEHGALLTAVGTVAQFEKDTLTIVPADKAKRLDLKVTGTSNIFLLTPQVRSGKTVLTQRSVTTSDLAAGQSVAVIYSTADKESVLLTAVIKPAENK